MNWKNRLIELTGPCGVGKTTVVLQHIKKNLNTAETLHVKYEVIAYPVADFLIGDCTFEVGGKKQRIETNQGFG